MPSKGRELPEAQDCKVLLQPTSRKFLNLQGTNIYSQTSGPVTESMCVVS